MPSVVENVLIDVSSVDAGFNVKMPRVVPDQREKFENDELFRKLSRESEIRYTGYRDLTIEDRQVRLHQELQEGHADIVFVNLGINLQLLFESNAWSSRAEDRLITTEFVDFTREHGKVHLKSQFILNGVCVIWRGWLDRQRLDGTAHLEYDDERAQQFKNNGLRSRVISGCTSSNHVASLHGTQSQTDCLPTNSMVVEFILLKRSYGLDVELVTGYWQTMSKPEEGQVAEWSIIELQGDLETKTPATTSNGQFIGDLHFTKKCEPVLIIGHHILFGKLVQLDKPLAVVVRESRDLLPDTAETVERINDSKNLSSESTPAIYVVCAIVKRKLIFKTRPKPIITNVPKKL